MEVTRKNFKEILPVVEEAIRTSSFITIDGEFTGLLDNNVLNAYDYPWEYYSKIRNGGMNYLMIQFGLCTFHYDCETKRYTHKGFNFYIYPYTNGQRNLDTSFLCQSSSLEFLAGNGFNFNKLFQEGIPFVNFAAEQKLKENFVTQKKSRELRRVEQAVPGSGGSISVPEKFAVYLKDVCDQVHRFIRSPDKRLELGENTNSYVRKLIFDTLEKNFNQDNLFVEGGVKKGGGRKDRIVVVTKEEGNREEILKRREQQWCRSMLEEIDIAVGFSTVIRRITESKKLVVGHNMLLDVCHCVHQFCADLPQEYKEFKALVNCVFPRLIDTKLMSSMYPLKEKFLTTTLLQLLEQLSEEPFKIPLIANEIGFAGYSIEDKKYHEAGFDAYITGVCFIAMANYLETLKKGTKIGLLLESPLLKPFENKLYLMKVQDIPYLDLIGKDALPPRDHVFYVTFPSSWTLQNLRSLFGPYGLIFVAWLNDSSAFVALEDRDKASLVSKTLLGSTTDSESYTVMPFLEYHGKKNGKIGNHGVHLLTKKQKEDLSPSVVRSSYSSEASAVLVVGVKRKRSSGESSFSKRSIDPIPEEKEDDIDKHLTTTADCKQGDSKKECLKEDLEEGETNGDSKEVKTDIEEAVAVKKKKAEDSEGSGTGSQPPSHVRAKRAKRREFDEDESWD